MIVLKKKIIVAIDGYSSCGKSSFARLIASSLHYIHLDSGAMYRAVALYALLEGLITDNQCNITELINKLSGIELTYSIVRDESHICLNGRDIEKEIRTIEISSIASTISKIGPVREYLVRLQQSLGKNKGIVMDGRDIGTVVFPDAEIKIFMTADLEVRTTRRYLELKEKKIVTSRAEVSKDINMRDNQDSTRKISPLRKADDAVVLDNSKMTFDEQMVWFRHLVKEKDLLI
jgi:cytidylate kinase